MQRKYNSANDKLFTHLFSLILRHEIRFVN
jgi:hypothetical protein